MQEINTDELLNVNFITEIFKEQIGMVMEASRDFYEQYDIEIANEQMYVPDEEREGHKIFAVIKFLPAEINFGQNVFPTTIQVVSESNSLIAAQRLLMEYAQIFNQNTLKRDGKLVYQNYTSPSVISNFDLVYEGYRSVLMMSGTFLISPNINRTFLQYYDVDNLLNVESIPSTKVTEVDRDGNAYDGIIYQDDCYVWSDSKNKYVYYEPITVNILNYSDSFSVTPDSQPYFNTKNFTESINKYGTFTFNIVTYLTKEQPMKKVLQITSRKKGINNKFYFKLTFDDEDDNMSLLPYKLIQANKNQNVGEMPAIVMAFTN